MYTVTAVQPHAGHWTGGFEVARDGAVVGRTRNIEDAQREIESDMHFYIAQFARGYLFVHAGVVEWRQRAIVLPGRSMCGKSSLVLALIRAGATYYSDEFAVVAPDGSIRPYAKSLSERRDGADPLLHSPDQLRAAPAGAAAPIGLVAMLRFRAGTTWNPRTLSRAEAVLGLFDNTVVARAQPGFALNLLTQAVRGAGALAGERGDATETASILLNS
jgi:hypothetical protein